MSRFVVLHHRFPASSDRRDHFDLMLEFGDSLQTWALTEWPVGSSSIIAERLPNHRIDYLDYEGVISANRGEVTRVASGDYQTISESADQLKVRLLETRFKPAGQGTGTFVLTRSNPNDDCHQWTCERLD